MHWLDWLRLNITVNIEPATLFTHKTAGFMQPIGAAVYLVAGNELYSSVVVVL